MTTCIVCDTNHHKPQDHPFTPRPNRFREIASEAFGAYASDGFTGDATVLDEEAFMKALADVLAEIG